MFNESTLLHNISPEQLREMLEAITYSSPNNIQPEAPKTNDELMTTDEVALYFKKHKDTINNWVKHKYLKKYAIGGAVFFKRSEIESAVIPLR